MGNVRNDKYKDKEGKTRTWTSVIIEDFNFCGSKAGAEGEEVPDLPFM
jgi:single-stranded DNA-binding protein